MEKALKFVLWTLGILGVLVGIGRAFLFVGWKVPMDPVLAASLAPTLRGGDYVLVLTVGTVKWGDLVRCPDPDDSSRWVVGRVMGMPGDDVAIKGGLLTVNGMRYDATEACKENKVEVPHPDSGSPVEMHCSRVEIGNNWHFRATGNKHVGSDDDQHSTSREHFYLLSDNRDFHDDSRDFGDIPIESCTERLFFRLWGPDGWMNSEERMTVIR
jgi:signal peptidase I